jgi:hypothetical protein
MIVLLAACTGDRPPMMDDNSLEATVAVSAEDVSEAEGATVATQGDDGDWALVVDGHPFDWHSASRAPLGDLDGRTLRIELDEVFGTLSGARVLEAGEPVLVSSISDGSEAFGEAKWGFGEAFGTGVVTNEYDESTDVVFHDVVVHGDDGDVTLLPGEPTAIRIDGETWRTTVLAAYRIEVDRSGGAVAGCGPSDLLAVELMRLDGAADEPALSREQGRLAAIASCG